jgi:hypothetical protein
MKKYGNTFNESTSEYAAGKLPIWLHVDEFYPAGCTLNTQPVGSRIPVGTPVYVPKVGAEAVVLETFEVVGAVAAAGTSVVLKSVSGAVQPAKDLIVGKASNGVVAKALKLPAVTSVGSGDHEGEYTFTITANSLGELSDGDILVMAVEAGSSKAAAMPTGLLYEDVLIGNKGATGTVVTKGQVLADRIADVPAEYLPYLTNITFVNE